LFALSKARSSAALKYPKIVLGLMPKKEVFHYKYIEGLLEHPSQEI